MTTNPHFESLVKSGIAAARQGDIEAARGFLLDAVELHQGDPRPWLWLSGTTDDPAERRDYLEHALAADPHNSAAKRGLLKLSGRLEGEHILAAGETVAPHPPTDPVAADTQTFTCPNCGGRMAYEPHHDELRCERCGLTQTVAAHTGPETAAPLYVAADHAEKVLDIALMTARGHRWAASQHRVTCDNCGAITLLPPKQVTTQCPYCGSNQLVASAETTELMDPQLIATFRLDAARAGRQVKRWLGQGFFAPDDLALLARAVNLRPAYLPFWTFDGALDVKYTCEVRVGEDHWEQRSGTKTLFFDDILVPGLRALSDAELERIRPYDLKALVEFQPEQLAGWHALTYDRSLADASLAAREQVMKDARRKLEARIESGREKRNVTMYPEDWSGLTYKHILLPLFTGTYHYKQREYRLLVNGQTGKVGGVKPRDQVKIAMVLAGAGILVLLGLFWLVWSNRAFLFGA